MPYTIDINYPNKRIRIPLGDVACGCAKCKPQQLTTDSAETEKPTIEEPVVEVSTVRVFTHDTISDWTDSELSDFDERRWARNSSEALQQIAYAVQQERHFGQTGFPNDNPGNYRFATPEDIGMVGGGEEGEGGEGFEGVGDAFKESDHPRGQPENKGEFAKSAGGATAKPGITAKPAAPAGTAAAPTTKPPPSAMIPAPTDRAQWPEHVKNARVPPAWKDVHISMDPKANTWASGRDANGKKQIVQNPEFAKSNSANKFSRVKELDEKFAAIHQQNEKLRKSSDPVVRDNADAMALVMDMGIRPGGEGTDAKTKAYGASTLLGRHVVQLKNSMRLRFTGKHAVALNLPVTNPDLAKMLAERAAKAGPTGALFPNANDKSLLAHAHSFNGGGFLTKDFRSRVGTKTAVAEIARMPAPTNAVAYKKACKAVAVVVSEKLGNTPTVALGSYINPVVFADWRAKAGV